MAGWDTENGTSVTATDRLRAALPGRRRRNAGLPEVAAKDEHARKASTSLREDRLNVVSDYIGDYPESQAERELCNQVFHPQPPERAAG
jgi:hypothetical protein